jgi:hypothetical protein
MMNELSLDEMLSMDRQQIAGHLKTMFEAVIEPLQPAASYPDTRGIKGLMSSFGFGPARDRYNADYGFVLLTKECVDALATFLRGKKVIDVGSGTGFLAHCLKNQGVDVTALDLPTLGTDGHHYWFRQIWTLDIADDFRNHLPGPYDVVILAWPNMGSSFANDVAQAMRPGQILIYEGENGGCTADDDFFNYTRGICWEPMEAETRSLNEHHRQFKGPHDRWYVLQKTDGVGVNRYRDIESFARDFRRMWETIMADVSSDGATKGSCLHASIALSMLLDQFAGTTTQICGGGEDEQCGLRDQEGRFRGHYWVEGTTRDGTPFIADITADQFGYDKVVIVHPDEGRDRYRLGDQDLVREHVEGERQACLKTLQKEDSGDTPGS